MLFDSFEAYDVQETRRISKEEGSTLRLITQVCKKIQKQIPLAEIAEMLDMSLSSVKMRKKRALKKLKQKMENSI